MTKIDTQAADIRHVRTALYVPASNERALAKARMLDVDMVIIDLEDSVSSENKDHARLRAIAESKAGFPGKTLALRLNANDSAYFDADVWAAQSAEVDYIVIPKVDDATALDAIAARLTRPIIAMIEDPLGIYNARDIAAHAAIVGLIAGANDICAEMGIKPGPNREGLELALQSIVLAAAASGKIAFDAVCNTLDDMTGFENECRQGRCYGFTGKTLIHPNQVAIANAAFGPSEADIADAQALIDEARGGAQRFQGRMIENMHVEAAKRTIDRAKRN
jgi:(3S)-malyl-CoA thioesterase